MTVRVRGTLVAATALALTAALAAPAIAANTGPAGRDGHHDATREAIEAAVADGVPGVTVTARDGRGGWSATAGVGDLRTGKPRSPRDHYRAGSITKTFVATVLLQLEAEGRLSLDDTVEKWLPGLVRGNGHDGRAITLRQLLNHTSGVFNYLDDRGFQETYMLAGGFLKHRYDRLTPQDLVAIAMSQSPRFDPGKSWSYSNTNYTLAALVIEKVTGHPYGTEVHRRITAPLGLKDTQVPGTSPTLPKPSSRAYSKLAKTTTGPTYDVTELNPAMAFGSGDMVSTSADLGRFYSALLRGRLLPPAQLKEMKTTVPETTLENVQYGLGLGDVTLSCGVHVWGHTGGIHGSDSMAVTTEDGRHTLAVNFNGDWSGDTTAVVDAEFCGR
ncbi:serine hydrolase domain-containing protein [Streptomyces sp. NPDC006332]|uniref:serine hydrolase domain-containing protein n=1 Tax=Streptomyces sp. NPDC006332 TaxID=3155456 RepID=UPI0033B5A715